MGGKKTVEDSRRFEKDRRDKLNAAFEELSKLLPEHDPSVTLTKIEILRRAAEYIKLLQEQNVEIMKLGADTALKNESEKLKKRVTNLILKTKELVDALRTAGVPIPTNNKRKRKNKAPQNSGSNQNQITEPAKQEDLQTSKSDTQALRKVKCGCMKTTPEKKPLKESNLTASTVAPVIGNISSLCSITTDAQTVLNTNVIAVAPSIISAPVMTTRVQSLSVAPNSESSVSPIQFKESILQLPCNIDSSTSFSSLEGTPCVTEKNNSAPLLTSVLQTLPINNEIPTLVKEVDPTLNSQNISISTSSSSNVIPTQSIVTSTHLLNIPQNNIVSAPITASRFPSVPVLEKNILSNLGPGTLILADGRIVNVPPIVPQIVVKQPPAVILLPPAKKKEKVLIPKIKDVTKTTFANKAPIPAIPPFRLEPCPKIRPKKKPKPNLKKVEKKKNQGISDVSNKKKKLQQTDEVNVSEEQTLAPTEILPPDDLITKTQGVENGEILEKEVVFDSNNKENSGTTSEIHIANSSNTSEVINNTSGSSIVVSVNNSPSPMDQISCPEDVPTDSSVNPSISIEEQIAPSIINELKNDNNVDVSDSILKESIESENNVVIKDTTPSSSETTSLDNPDPSSSECLKTGGSTSTVVSTDAQIHSSMSSDSIASDENTQILVNSDNPDNSNSHELLASVCTPQPLEPSGDVPNCDSAIKESQSDAANNQSNYSGIDSSSKEVLSNIPPCISSSTIQDSIFTSIDKQISPDQSVCSFPIESSCKKVPLDNLPLSDKEENVDKNNLCVSPQENHRPFSSESLSQSDHILNTKNSTPSKINKPSLSCDIFKQFEENSNYHKRNDSSSLPMNNGSNNNVFDSPTESCEASAPSKSLVTLEKGDTCQSVSQQIDNQKEQCQKSNHTEVANSSNVNVCTNNPNTPLSNATEQKTQISQTNIYSQQCEVWHKDLNTSKEVNQPILPSAGRADSQFSFSSYSIPSASSEKDPLHFNVNKNMTSFPRVENTSGNVLPYVSSVNATKSVMNNAFTTRTSSSFYNSSNIPYSQNTFPLNSYSNSTDVYNGFNQSLSTSIGNKLVYAQNSTQNSLPRTPHWEKSHGNKTQPIYSGFGTNSCEEQIHSDKNNFQINKQGSATEKPSEQQMKYINFHNDSIPASSSNNVFRNLSTCSSMFPTTSESTMSSYSQNSSSVVHSNSLPSIPPYNKSSTLGEKLISQERTHGSNSNLNKDKFCDGPVPFYPNSTQSNISSVYNSAQPISQSANIASMYCNFIQSTVPNAFNSPHHNISSAYTSTSHSNLPSIYSSSTQPNISMAYSSAMPNISHVFTTSAQPNIYTNCSQPNTSMYSNSSQGPKSVTSTSSNQLNTLGLFSSSQPNVSHVYSNSSHVSSIYTSQTQTNITTTTSAQSNQSNINRNFSQNVSGAHSATQLKLSGNHISQTNLPGPYSNSSKTGLSGTYPSHPNIPAVNTSTTQPNLPVSYSNASQHNLPIYPGTNQPNLPGIYPTQSNLPPIYSSIAQSNLPTAYKTTQSSFPWPNNAQSNLSGSYTCSTQSSQSGSYICTSQPNSSGAYSSLTQASTSGAYSVPSQSNMTDTFRNPSSSKPSSSFTSSSQSITSNVCTNSNKSNLPSIYSSSALGSSTSKSFLSPTQPDSRNNNKTITQTIGSSSFASSTQTGLSSEMNQFQMCSDNIPESSLFQITNSTKAKRNSEENVNTNFKSDSTNTVNNKCSVNSDHNKSSLASNKNPELAIDVNAGMYKDISPMNNNSKENSNNSKSLNKDQRHTHSQSTRSAYSQEKERYASSKSTSADRTSSSEHNLFPNNQLEKEKSHCSSGSSTNCLPVTIENNDENGNQFVNNYGFVPNKKKNIQDDSEITTRNKINENIEKSNQSVSGPSKHDEKNARLENTQHISNLTTQKSGSTEIISNNTNYNYSNLVAQEYKRTVSSQNNSKLNDSTLQTRSYPNFSNAYESLNNNKFSNETVPLQNPGNADICTTQTIQQPPTHTVSTVDSRLTSESVCKTAQIGIVSQSASEKQDKSIQKSYGSSDSGTVLKEISPDFLKSKDIERNTFIPITYDDVRLSSDFSADLFSSLQVPAGGQHSESISPTAAFLLAFPLVSSSRNVESLHDTENNENHTSTPTTILQIGNIEPPSTELFHPIDFQKTKSTDHFDINNDYLHVQNDLHDKQSSGYKRCEKRKDTYSEYDKDVRPTDPKQKSKSTVSSTNTYTQSYTNPLLSCNEYQYCEKDNSQWQQGFSASIPKEQQKKMCERKKGKNPQKGCYNQNYQDYYNYKDNKKQKQENRISVNWMSTSENREQTEYPAKEPEVNLMGPPSQSIYSSISLDFQTEPFPDFCNSKKPNSYSWSPSKSLLPSLDNHLMIPSTLPTLVGDLALGTTTPSESYKTYETSKLPTQGQQMTKKSPEKVDENKKNNEFPKSHANFFSVSQLVDAKSKKQKTNDRNYKRTEKTSKSRSTCKNRKEDNCFYFDERNNYMPSATTQCTEKRLPYKGGNYSAESLIGAQHNEIDFSSSFNYQQNSNYIQTEFSHNMENASQQYGYFQQTPFSGFNHDEFQDFGFNQSLRGTDNRQKGSGLGKKEDNYHGTGPLQSQIHPTYSKGLNYNLPSSHLNTNTTTTLTNFNLSTIFPEMNDQRVGTSGQPPAQQINTSFPNSQNYRSHLS